MHDLIMGTLPGHKVVHKNGNTLDNREENLEFQPIIKQIIANRKIPKGFTDKLPKYVKYITSTNKKDGTFQDKWIIIKHPNLLSNQKYNGSTNMTQDINKERYQELLSVLTILNNLTNKITIDELKAKLKS
jgi:hypothetical protein